MAYDPATYDNALMYLPVDTAKMFSNTGTTPATVGGYVRQVSSGVTGAPTWDSITDARRPQLVDATGALQFGTLEASARYLRLPGNTGNYTKVLHESGAFGMVSLKMDATPTITGGRIIHDNTAFSNTKGVRLQIGSDGKIAFIVTNGSAQALTLTSTQTVTDNAWHRIKYLFLPAPAVSWLAVDNDIVFGVAGTLSTGVGTEDMFVGNRSATNAPIPAQIRDLWIGTARPSAAQEAEWDAQNPKGSISGNPVVDTGSILIPLNKDRGYNPIAPLYFAGVNVYPTTATDGPVFDDGGADDNPDGDSWRGGPHGDETVISATFNGVPVADGTIYGPGTLVVTSQIGDSFAAVKTTKFDANTIVTRLQMTRLADGLSINPSYPLRFGRAVTLAAYVALDADGNILEDSTASATNGTVYPMPSLYASDPVGARGVAQFSSTLGVMALTVLTKGYGLDEEFTITGESADKRLYLKLAGARRNPAQGTVIDLAATTKYFVTDSGSWKALAQSELLKITASGGGRRSGFGFGFGFRV